MVVFRKKAVGRCNECKMALFRKKAVDKRWLCLGRRRRMWRMLG